MPLGFPGGSAGGGSPRPMSWTLATDYDVSMVTSLAGACNWAARAAPDGTIHYAFIRDGSGRLDVENRILPNARAPLDAIVNAVAERASVRYHEHVISGDDPQH